MTRILVIKMSSLGDIVHGLQVMQTIKTQLNPCHISWVVRAPFAALVTRAGCVDRTLIWDTGNGLREALAIAGRLRSGRYDIVLDMQGLLASGVLTGLARAPQKWGRRDSREGAGWFYRQRVDMPAGKPPYHAIDILRAFGKPFGLNPAAARPLHLKPAPAPAWADFLQTGPDPLVVMFPDSSIRRKQWHGFEAPSRRLLAWQPRLRLIWCARRPMAPAQAFPQQRFLDLTGCPLDEMITLLGFETLVIGNDSGPLHLAAALQRRLVSIFGPTSVARFAPYPAADSRHKIITAPGGRLQDLAVGPVLTAVQALLAEPEMR
jgi:ADP-heptose:LPS heptosyltransferase